LEERLRKLVERFESIGEQTLRDLPLFNAGLCVEALGFERDGDDFLGALITPWFINIVALPTARLPYDEARVGEATTLALPRGETRFTLGGDRAIGMLRSHPVRTSTVGVENQEQARALAREALAALRTGFDPGGTRLSRRQFLGR